MDNIFQIGGAVSGDSFIGRAKLIDKYRKEYLESTNRVGKSIVGLTRIGKTSFSDVVFSDVSDGVLVIDHDLKLSDSYYGLWKKICIKIGKYLRKHNIEADYLAELLDDIKNNSNMEWVEFEENIVDIFDELNDLGIRTIIVLDEFDYAESLFEGKTHYFELFRTIFADHKVSAMLLSRRQLHNIEKTTYQSSTFHGILEPIYFKGFDEEDMEEYYAVFKNGGIDLSEEQKDEIEYYAGRAPFLLSIIGHYIVETANEGTNIDVTKIFMNKCKAINDYYRDCMKHLERDDDIRRIVPFVIGPNVGVTQNDRDELFNLGYLREENDELTAISGYFVNFLSANMLQVSIWDNIISLEKKMKLLIENEMIGIINHFSAGGESINAIQRNILEQIEGVSNSLSMYDTFIANNMRVFSIESTYLDVISLKDSFRIIKECWTDIFSKYFGNEMYSEWENKFAKCGKARNPIAHGHEEYLSDLDKNEVDTYCKQIFDIVVTSNIVASVPSESEILHAAANYRSTTNAITEVKYEDPIESLVGQSVDMVVLMRGGQRRSNLRGIIDNKYKGIIPRTDLTTLDSDGLDAMVGTTVRVWVDRINGDHYELRYGQDGSGAVVADRSQTSLGYAIGDLTTNAMGH